MATKATAKKATEVKATEATQTTKAPETKVYTFTGIVRSFFQATDDLRLVKFDTLNASKTRVIQFQAALFDTDIYLAGYIKSHTPVEVEVVELPKENDDKRRFKIISIMSQSEKQNFEALKALAQ